MRKICVLVLLALFVQISHASVSSIVNPPVKKELAYSKSLTAKDVESFLGRKMTFGEKVAFKIRKKAYVKTINEEESGTNGWAIAGFVCSLIIPPLGIIFSAIGLSQIKKSNQKGKGLAIAGLIIGIAFTLLLLI